MPKPGQLRKGEHERHDVSLDEHKFERVTTYDTAIVMEAAEAERQLGNNGFSKERGSRVIGEIPLAEFLELQRVAQESGDDLTGTDLRKFLQKNREYMTVPRLNTGHKGKIIIK